MRGPRNEIPGERAGFGRVNVAAYYLRRGAYVAAVNRAQFALINYREAPAIERALIVLVKAYDEMGLPDLRDGREAHAGHEFSRVQRQAPSEQSVVEALVIRTTSEQQEIALKIRERGKRLSPGAPYRAKRLTTSTTRRPLSCLCRNGSRPAGSRANDLEQLQRQRIHRRAHRRRLGKDVRGNHRPLRSILAMPRT